MAVVAQIDRDLLRLAPGRAASRLVGYSLFEGRPVTTAGRWWNPVVFRNLKLATGLPGKRIDRPVFIVGMGRSGTTLLGQILAAHPDVGFLNEPKAMWHVIRSDEDIIGSYAPPNTGRLHLDAGDADEAVRGRAQALFSWYLRVSRSKRVVDKYPELIFRHSFVRAIFPDARFLIAVRSPWSTLRSVDGWSSSHGTADADWWGVRDQKWRILWTQGVAGSPASSDLQAMGLANERDHRLRAAVEWIVTMRQAISLAAEDPLARVIHYEDLVERPRPLVRQMLPFCGLAASSRTETYAATVVTAGRSASDRHLTASQIPEPIVAMIDDTWARLRAVDRTARISGEAH